MNMVHHLVITENKLYAHLHTMKVYNTRLVLTPPPPTNPIKVLLIKIPLFLKTEVFTCSKVFKAFK